MQQTYQGMDQWLGARGRDVYASDGDKIGSFEDLYTTRRIASPAGWE